MLEKISASGVLETLLPAARARYDGQSGAFHEAECQPPMLIRLHGCSPEIWFGRLLFRSCRSASSLSDQRNYTKVRSHQLHFRYNTEAVLHAGNAQYEETEVCVLSELKESLIRLGCTEPTPSMILMSPVVSGTLKCHYLTCCSLSRYIPQACAVQSSPRP
jgi:hypothetical protein